MNAVVTVFAKEVLDNCRDRRTLLSALGVAAGGPLLFVLLMTFVLDRVIDEGQAPLAVPVLGAAHAPELLAALERNGVQVLPGPDDPEAAVRSRRSDVVLVVPERFAEQFSAGRPAGLRIVYDSTRAATSERDYRRLAAILQRLSGQYGALRLQARGIDPNIARPFSLGVSDLASPSARAVSLLGMVPYFLVFAVFMGGFYLAIDTTAGERDLGSLEPLLTLPVRREALALGKMLATALFSLVTLGLAVAAFALAIGRLPLAELGMAVRLGPLAALGLTLTVAPLCCFAAAVMTVVASLTASFKEAQTWLSLLILVPTLPLFTIVFLNPQATPLTMLVPSLSQALLINAFLEGAVPAASLIATSVLSTLALAALTTLLALRLYRREKLLG